MAQCGRAGRGGFQLVDVELDDNYREWDDDLTAGPLHPVERLVFLHVVRAIGSTDPLKLDLFPVEKTDRPRTRKHRDLRRLEEPRARSTPKSWPPRRIDTMPRRSSR